MAGILTGAMAEELWLEAKQECSGLCEIIFFLKFRHAQREGNQGVVQASVAWRALPRAAKR